MGQTRPAPPTGGRDLGRTGGAVTAPLRRRAPGDLPLAAVLGQGENLQRLLPGADPAQRHLAVALALAAQLGRIAIARLLLNAGEDPNRYNRRWQALPLHTLSPGERSEAIWNWPVCSSKAARASIARMCSKKWLPAGPITRETPGPKPGCAGSKSRPRGIGELQKRSADYRNRAASNSVVPSPAIDSTVSITDQVESASLTSSLKKEEIIQKPGSFT